MVSAASRFNHPGFGNFDMPLPSDGSGIEPRSDGSGNNTIVFNFDKPVTSGTAMVTSGAGTASSVTYSGNSMIVSLTGVTDQQTTMVTASTVAGSGTQTLASAVATAGFLIGDVTADRGVNVGDTIQTRNAAGGVINNPNFQYDVNVDGGIDVGDTIVVRSKSGDFLP
jgi:hypothetical protein